MPTDKTLICRITHFDNLEGILIRKGIYAPNFVPDDNIPFRPIHYVGIQNQRSLTNVPCGQGGCIHDYVPFYFGPLSPMLYAINKDCIEGYDGGQQPVIYIWTYAEQVKQSRLDFVFTDGHAIMTPLTSFYDDLRELDKISWDIIHGKYWFDNEQHPDRKRRRQAEFLVHRFLPMGCILGIIVIDKDMKDRVELKLEEHSIKLPVKVNRSWYY